ncbi:SAM-dependent methyltransferase [Symbioplanes lichenis]|uniref:SAM-dependent methyltransferase n=1 Tax=Symbioplanes lichenis TaxID=1629072 RepID=UPI002738FD53|nr:SAM-dependent methyltransferase [Actinoplanes lichenis]
MSQPSVARMYDFYLGGEHHTAADRAAGEQILRAVPNIREIARANRAFLGRAVRHLTAAGIRQFLDIGSGIPASGNVHEVAPGARVLYVDVDAEAVAYSNELLRGNDNALAVQADLAAPSDILGHPDYARLLDPDEPTALLFLSVLQFVPDEVAVPAVRTLREALPVGSYLALTHPVVPPDDARAAPIEAVYRQTNARATAPRTAGQLAALAGDYRPVEPGLTWVTHWRPAGDPGPADPVGMPMMAGVFRRDTTPAP